MQNVQHRLIFPLLAILILFSISCVSSVAQISSNNHGISTTHQSEGRGIINNINSPHVKDVSLPTVV